MQSDHTKPRGGFYRCKCASLVTRALVRLVEIYHAPKDTRELGLNADTNLIKIVACLTMFCDHLGKMVFSGAPAFMLPGALAALAPAGNFMRVIGRLAMPMFCYCIAVGSAYTRNVWKYALRLLVLAILVHPLYMEAMGHVGLNAFDWGVNFYRLDKIYTYYYASRLNILFSLFFGVALLGFVKSKAYVCASVLAYIVWRYSGMLDYGWKAVCLIALSYAFLDKPFASFAAVFLFMIYWATPTTLLGSLSFRSTQFYALAALPLIYLPLKRRVKIPKSMFYLFYPAHLLVIYLILTFK